MKTMKRSDVILVVDLLCRAFPRFVEPSPWEPDLQKVISGKVDLWTQRFSEYDAATVAAAVNRYIDSHEFPPTVADIRRIIADATLPQITPGEIWQECYRLLNADLGPYEEEAAYARMSDACREGVMACGGWYALSLSPEDDPHVRRAFLRAAEGRLQRDRETGVPFDRSRMNTLQPRPEALRIGGAVRD
jgi:hypothetical protein